MPPCRTFTCLIVVSLLLVAPVRAADVAFGRQVAPLLYKLGCSAGTCHGSFQGKGGFRLSLFASDPDADYQNIRGLLGRRLDLHQPENSLLLLKPTAGVEHVGGWRLKVGSAEYQLLRNWIAGGARYDPEREGRVIGLAIEPASFMLRPGEKPQPLKVIANLSTGKSDEVTHLTRFESLDTGIASVDEGGAVSALRPGDAAVLAYYAGQVAFTRVLAPGALPQGLTFPQEELRDPVDRLLVERLKKVNIVPSPVCEDLEFFRRVHLDVVGSLPTPEAIRKFASDRSPDRRAKLIDRLLEHPDHAALWAGRLCDLIGADDRFIGNGVYTFHDWFRYQLEKNTRWDRIAYGVICATAADGRDPEQIKADLKREAEERKAKKTPDPSVKPWHTGPALKKTLPVFYENLINQKTLEGGKRIVDGKQIALRVAHMFLGVRLECAQCHKHPHDRWTQQDFYSFATVFSHVHLGVDPELQKQKVNLNGAHVRPTPAEEYHDPVTDEVLGPRILGGSAITVKPGVDPRQGVWQWLVNRDNPYFAHAIVNRVWEHYFSRGLIDPVDALAAANPPSHPEVLEELVRDFIAHKYDLRHLHRRLLNTVAYQRSWKTNPTNAKDQRNFSHRLLRRLTAEQAVDAIAQVTGTPPKLAKRYADVRPNQRAVDLALSRVGGDDGYVLQIFGRPIRVQNCDCERSSATSLSQSLYLYNDEKLLERIADPKGRVQKLVSEIKDDRRLIEELYLWTLSRFPTPAEIDRTLAHLKGSPSRLEGYQDLVWSLLNRNEFLVNY